MVTPEITVHAFIDWKNVAYALRPARPRSGSWRTDPATAVAVLKNLRTGLIGALEGDRDAIVETLIYGGFTRPDGSDAPELITLNEALASAHWEDTSARTVRFEPVMLVKALRPGGSPSLSALYRPSEPIGEAALRPVNQPCSCKWRRRTEEWLECGTKEQRVCPQCKRSPPRLAILCRDQQKLVDTLLATHALDRGVQILRSGPGAAPRAAIWLCSGDSDCVPPLAQLATWGVPCAWIQPQRNERYRYADALRDLGVEVKVLGNSQGESNS